MTITGNKIPVKYSLRLLNGGGRELKLEAM